MSNSLKVRLPPAVLMCLVLAAPIAQTARADIDFDNLPNAYLFLGGDQNIGSYYPGVDFESNVTGINLAGSTAFPPPNSGSIVAWDPVDLFAAISFAGPQSMVGVWYTSLDPLTLDSYDSTGALLGSVVGAANTDGTTGQSDFLSLTDPNIASVTLSGTPGNYVFDDVTFSPETNSVVPEPSFAVLLGLALGAFICLKCCSNRSRAISKQ